MKEQLVSFKVAKLAKEKGFNYAYEFYDKDGKLEEFGMVSGWCNSTDENYPAPTQSLLQKWLREEHNIHIVIDVAYNGKGILEGYSHVVYGNATKKMDVLLAYIEEPWFVDIYEDALEIGLEQALKLIDNGDKNKV